MNFERVRCIRPGPTSALAPGPDKGGKGMGVLGDIPGPLRAENHHVEMRGCPPLYLPPTLGGDTEGGSSLVPIIHPRRAKQLRGPGGKRGSWSLRARARERHGIVLCF